MTHSTLESVVCTEQGDELAATFSLDHLAGAGQHGLPVLIEAECLGGLEVRHQFVFGRRRAWQVGRLFTLEDAIDVAGRAAVLFDFIRPVGNSLRMGGSSTPPPPLREIERNNAISPHRNSG